MQKVLKKYRDLLKGNFDINRVMRIERKDDLYTMGYSMADFHSKYESIIRTRKT